MSLSYPLKVDKNTSDDEFLELYATMEKEVCQMSLTRCRKRGMGRRFDYEDLVQETWIA